MVLLFAAYLALIFCLLVSFQEYFKLQPYLHLKLLPFDIHTGDELELSRIGQANPHLFNGKQ